MDPSRGMANVPTMQPYAQGKAVLGLEPKWLRTPQKKGRSHDAAVILSKKPEDCQYEGCQEYCRSQHRESVILADV
eukprot:5860327-Amphidinium_carterae.2